MPVPASVSALPCREIRSNLRAGARQTLFVEPVRSYVICCVQRTGSWLLAHTLADTGSLRYSLAVQPELEPMPRPVPELAGCTD